MKLMMCMWLVLSVFNGTAYVFENYVRKYMKLGRVGGSNYTDDQKILQMISLNARKYAVEYVEKHGWPAFERIINAAEKEAKKHQVYAVSTAAIPFYHWIVKECLCLYI
ncbi:hypothetical protein V6N11_002102 [Hibiscus sabdariffa]|uniref:Uncharacterized protein n=1 Tax=Hibiscus sabdariffa TaxID=183260 RepID=A0ABR2QUG3_9ROSI